MSRNLDLFERRLFDKWLPAYCDDADRRYDCAGFRRGSMKVSDVDARDFMRALGQRIVTDLGGGRYSAPRSYANESIFWEGRKSSIPRPITLWIEPVVTIAAVGRLHFDYGWPKELLGMQSIKWEFDLAAYLTRDAHCEHIAGEVKKSVAELDEMIEHMQTFAVTDAALSPTASSRQRNAYKKYRGLVDRRAKVFWAVAPGGVERIFRISYGDSTLRMTAADPSALVYPGNGETERRPKRGQVHFPIRRRAISRCV